jgi:hypothetical protein
MGGTEQSLRDPEDRVIDEYSEEQKRDKAMDKTLADSFPASDPPAWQARVRKPGYKGGPIAIEEEHGRAN